MDTYFDEIDAIHTSILHNVTHERWFFSTGARRFKNRENSYMHTLRMINIKKITTENGILSDEK